MSTHTLSNTDIAAIIAALEIRIEVAATRAVHDVNDGIMLRAADALKAIAPTFPISERAANAVRDAKARAMATTG